MNQPSEKMGKASDNPVVLGLVRNVPKTNILVKALHYQGVPVSTGLTPTALGV